MLIRLGIFGHSHMDELRLLERPKVAAAGRSQHGVAVKVVPSISPVDGNNPALPSLASPEFGRAAGLPVIAASNQTGIDTAWSREYDFGQAYQETNSHPRR